MISIARLLSSLPRTPARSTSLFTFAAGLVTLAGCAGGSATSAVSSPRETATTAVAPRMTPLPLRVTPPSPDPRVGLGAGLFDAEHDRFEMFRSQTKPWLDSVEKSPATVTAHQ